MEFIRDGPEFDEIDNLINLLREEIGEHGHESAYKLKQLEYNALLELKTKYMQACTIKVIITPKEYEGFIHI